MSKIVPILGQEVTAVVIRTILPPRDGKASLPIARAFDSEGILTTFTLFVQGLPAEIQSGTRIITEVVSLDKRNKLPHYAFVDYVRQA